MLVAFLPALDGLGELINSLLKLQPTSMESFDDHTLKFAFRFFLGFYKTLGWKRFILLGLSFIPVSWVFLSQPLEGLDRLLNGFRIPVDSVGPPHVAFADPKRGIWGEQVSAVELKKMVILDDRLRILLFFEEGFGRSPRVQIRFSSAVCPS